ncbi:MAG: LysE family transporter [Microscillaceae bacterium]|nr:LysE family transporter [Microscillaceae bacterium]
MPETYWWSMILGFAGSFAGTIPFGPINMTVVGVTLKKGAKAAWVVSIAAALVEILQSSLAFWGGKMLVEMLERSPFFQLGLFLLFLLLAISFWLKKPQVLSSRPIHGKMWPCFLRGLIVSLLNPQAIPFWVLVFSFYQMQGWLFVEAASLFLLFTGVMLGKFACLGLYSFFSLVIVRRVHNLTLWMNKILAVIFLAISLGAFGKYWSVV